MNFVVLGNICIDKNNFEGKLYEKAGGSPVFISNFLKKQGEKLTIISSYGPGFLQYKNGFNLYPSEPNITHTLVYENTVLDGKRTQRAKFFENYKTVEVDSNAAKVLKNADCLFFTPLLPSFEVNYLVKVIRNLNSNCLKILLPQGYFRDFDNEKNVIFREFKEADKVLPLFDFAVLSNEDYPNMEELSKLWSEKFGIKIIITKGELGACLVENGAVENFPTTLVKKESIKDTIGAGDTFAAAFGFELLKNKKLSGAINFANKAAKEKILNF